ncbi:MULTISPECIES: alpha/beta fold hydrolase [Nocardiaceae]|uniref:alpha/beta fold hydrolase n=1 Tax=Nocardiaceae TaxID=85025 RepID=UPI000B177D72|nr:MULTISPECIES: alpha/beta fold hydrolase [Rhodococcus]
MTIWTELAGLDFCMKTVDAAGVPTRSLQAGSGDEAVIFLHGTSGHLEAFARNIAVHAECHAIDMHGHGYTGKPDYPYEIPRYVEHLAAYMDAVGLSRAHLVGESLGGWVAAYLASDQPERVLSLQLLAAGGTVANSVVMDRIKSSTMRAVQTDDIELTRSRMHLVMHDPADATDELIDVRHRIYHQPDFIANIGNLLTLQSMETRQRNLLRPDRLAKIVAPTLVVWGGKRTRSATFPRHAKWPRTSRAHVSNCSTNAGTGLSTSSTSGTTHSVSTSSPRRRQRWPDTPDHPTTDSHIRPTTPTRS